MLKLSKGSVSGVLVGLALLVGVAFVTITLVNDYDPIEKLANEQRVLVIEREKATIERDKYARVVDDVELKLKSIEASFTQVRSSFTQPE